MYTVCQGDEGEQDTHTICVRRADSRRLERRSRELKCSRKFLSRHGARVAFADHGVVIKLYRTWCGPGRAEVLLRAARINFCVMFD